MAEETTVNASGPDAYDRVRRMLEHSGIDKEDVMEVEVTVVHTTDREKQTSTVLSPPVRKPDESGDAVGISPVQYKVLSILEGDEGWMKAEDIDEMLNEDEDAQQALVALCEEHGQAVRRELDDGEKEYAAGRDREIEVEYGPTPGNVKEGHSHGGGGGHYEGPLAAKDFEGTIRPDTNMGKTLKTLIDNDHKWWTSRQCSEETELSTTQASSCLSDLFHDRGYVKRQKSDETHSRYEYKPTEDGVAALEEGLRRVRKIAETGKEEKE